MKPIKQTRAVKLFLASIQTAPDKRLSISYRELSELLCITVRSVQKLINRLESASLIRVERNLGQFKANTYSINQTYYQLLEHSNHG